MSTYIKKTRLHNHWQDDLTQWRSQELKFAGTRLGHKIISEKLEILSLLGIHEASL